MYTANRTYAPRSRNGSNLWGARARALEARHAEARSVDAGLSLLVEGLGVPPRAPNPVQRTIEYIASHNGAVNLAFAATQANLSPRPFRRRCLDESGLSPKHLCRVLRFRYANMGLAHDAQRPNWSHIAAEAGYFDQAHLIGDFHEFTQRTPVSVLSNTRGV